MIRRFAFLKYILYNVDYLCRMEARLKLSVKIFLGFIILGLCLGINLSYASGDTFSSSYSYLPHVYLSGFAGSSVTGTGDVLQPIWQRSDRNLFFYGQGNYGYSEEDWAKNTWAGSAGFGYRQVGDVAVYGLYVLGDYNRTTTDHTIWQVSPGIEILGRAWEFHANAYVPVGKKSWSTDEFASELGNYDYIHFSGHNQFDAKFRFSEEAGGGADAELGRTLFKVHNTLVTGFVNGYYFRMQDNTDLRGAGAAITVQPNAYLKLSVNGSYDNYAHTVVMVGAQVSLYDLFSNASKIVNTNDLQRRLFEPVERGFANLASGNVTRMTGGPRDEENRKTAIPIVLGHDFLQRTNVWFFNGTGLNNNYSADQITNIADGTYEHPYTSADFNQTTVKQIFDDTLATGAFTNAYLYFNKGTYNTYASGLNTNFIRLELFPGESMWGRMGTQKGFQMPATGANRPDFIGSLKLDSNTSLNNIKLQNNSIGGFTSGVLLDNAQDVRINNSKIGVDGPNGGFVAGVEMDNVSTLAISGSQLYGYNGAISSNLSLPNPTDAAGLEVQDGCTVESITNSLIQGYSAAGDGYGLYIESLSFGFAQTATVGNINNSTFIGQGADSGYGAYIDSFSNSGDTIAIIGNIKGSSFMGQGGTFGFGLFMSSNSAMATATLTVGNISDSVFAGNGGTSGSGMLVKSFSGSSSTTKTTIGNITDSTFSGGGSNSNGLVALSTGDQGSASTQIGNIKNSNFTVTDGNNAYGLFVSSFSAALGKFATTTIGNISGSHFTTGAGNNNAGLYVSSEAATSANSTTVIGAITNNIFTSSYAGISLFGATVKVNGTLYDNTTVQNLYNALLSTNTFTGALTEGAVCIEGSCNV